MTRLRQRLKGLKRAVRITEQMGEQFKKAGPAQQTYMLDALEHFLGQFRRADREAAAAARAAGRWRCTTS